MVIWDNIHLAPIIDESIAIVTNPKSDVCILGRVIFNTNPKSILINGGAVLARNFNHSKALFASVFQLNILAEECLMSIVNSNAIFAKFLIHFRMTPTVPKKPRTSDTDWHTGHLSIFTIISCVTCPPNKETTVPRALNAGVAKAVHECTHGSPGSELA